MKVSCRERMSLWDIVNDLKIEVDDLASSHGELVNSPGITSLKGIIQRLESIVNQEDDPE